MGYHYTHQRIILSIQSQVLPVIFTRDLESQVAEEGGSVTLHCELSKPGVHVEWKNGSEVLSSGEKYLIKQTGFCHELHILDLTPGDTGSYSCCLEDAISSASLLVNGMMGLSHVVLFFHQVLHLLPNFSFYSFFHT